MDETAALHALRTKLEAQISRQCATILELRRDLAQAQEDTRRLIERMSAGGVLDALAPDLLEDKPRHNYRYTSAEIN